MLLRVDRDRAFAVAALEAELARAAQLDPRDRALATELAYGALRVRPWIEEAIGRYATRGVSTIDPRVRAHLVVAAYQLFFLSRVPAFAAVSACVDAVRRVTAPKVAGFANAILRRLAADAQARPVPLETAVVASAAPWLRAALARALGEDGATRFLASAAETPPTGLRVERAEDRDAWIARLREAVPSAVIEPGQVSPRAIVARGLGRLSDLPGFAAGEWLVQEEGSQLIALAAGAAAGETVLDACAGRGNKTSLFARAVLPGGAVDAADLHASKLERLTQELARLSLAPRRTFAVDWSLGAGDVDGTYDRVVVDAPCSGVGTLRRRPDLHARRAADELAQLATLQHAIAARASERLRVGGRLVYAVCSVLREESEDVVARLAATNPELVLTPFAGADARALAGDVPTLRLLPHVHGTDGYFLASFEKRA